MTSPNNRASVEPANLPDKRYKGVRGWLFLYVMCLTVLNPVITLLSFLFVDFSLYRFAAVGLACFSVYAGLSLWTIRTNAVRIAKGYLIVQLAYSVAVSILAFLLAASPEQRLEVLGAAGSQVLGAYIYYAVWYSYLKKSKRVAATYPTPAFQADARVAKPLSPVPTQTPEKPSEAGTLLSQPKGERFVSGRIRSVSVAFGIAMLLVVVGGPMLWFVWPTPYRYDHIHIGSSVFPVRIHRLTGKTEILLPRGWQERPASAEHKEKLPEKELSKLQGEASWDTWGHFAVSLYNGTEWRIDAITVRVTTLSPPSRINWNQAAHDQEFLSLPGDRKLVVLSRLYKVAELPATEQTRVTRVFILGRENLFSFEPISRLYRLSGDSSPYTTSKFDGDLGFIPSPGQTWDWSVVEATATRR